MPWAQFIVQWLHLFFAMVWLGGTALLFAVVGPSLKQSDPTAAMQVGEQIGRRTQMVLGPAGALTIIFGLLRATVFGPARSLTFFSGSAYGTTMLVALVLAIIIAVLGGVTGRIAGSLGAASADERQRLLARITLLSGASIVGFVLALTCMILMRYGL